MKVRQGFVSNSSSSSFICVGTQKQDAIEKLLAKEGLKKNEEGYYDGAGYGTVEGDFLVFIGSDDPTFAGIPETLVLEMLEEFSLPGVRSFVSALFSQAYNLEIPEDEIRLEFGESSDDW